VKVPIILEDEEFNAAVTIQKSSPRNGGKTATPAIDGALIRSQRGGYPDFPPRSLPRERVRFAPNTPDKVRYACALCRNSAGIRRDRAG
jgi:hypothetical protein